MNEPENNQETGPSEQQSPEPDRGRDALLPWHIPPRGWRDIALRFAGNLQKDYIQLIAAGVAFYFILAAFPALAALISIYGIFADPAVLAEQFELMRRFLPPDAFGILASQIARIASAGQGVLSLSLFFSLLLTTYSATKGMRALVQGFNIAYKETEKRNFLKLNWLCFWLTLVLMIYFMVSLSLVAGLPAIVQLIPMPEIVSGLLLLLRWPLLMTIAFGGLAILYKYGPSRRRPRWRWITFGSAGATLLWIAASSVFSLYVSNFAAYNETYGSLGAVIILLMWFWISALAILVGAEINATIEHQTARDTTVGPERPMGSRGAYVADTLGRVP